MRFFVGTSGYAYKEWKGSFYPEKMSPKEMLPYYSERFASVEINNTFYRMPDAETVESWTGQVPASFRFVLKAPQTITHRKRLKNVEEETEQFLAAAAVLKRRQGPLLFQLPPNMKKDLPRLADFLSLIGKQAAVAFEFRHESWFDDDVYDTLRKYGGALCWADAEELPEPPIVATAAWGYLRLRRVDYPKKQLAVWLERIRSQSWSEAYVFFKHEDAGTGPKFASRLLELIEAT